MISMSVNTTFVISAGNVAPAIVLVITTTVEHVLLRGEHLALRWAT